MLPSSSGEKFIMSDCDSTSIESVRQPHIDAIVPQHHAETIDGMAQTIDRYAVALRASDADNERFVRALRMVDAWLSTHSYAPTPAQTRVRSEVRRLKEAGLI